jgi:hypothetical protein
MVARVVRAGDVRLGVEPKAPAELLEAAGPAARGAVVGTSHG